MFLCDNKKKILKKLEYGFLKANVKTNRMGSAK